MCRCRVVDDPGPAVVHRRRRMCSPAEPNPISPLMGSVMGPDHDQGNYTCRVLVFSGSSSRSTICNTYANILQARFETVAIIRELSPM